MLCKENCLIYCYPKFSINKNIYFNKLLFIAVTEARPTINMDAPTEHKVKIGSDTDIKINFTAAPKPTDEWTVNGNVIIKSKRLTSAVDEETVTLTIRKVQKEDAGDYTLKLINIYGDAKINIKLTVLRKFFFIFNFIHLINIIKI